MPSFRSVFLFAATAFAALASAAPTGASNAAQLLPGGSQLVPNLGNGLTGTPGQTGTNVGSGVPGLSGVSQPANGGARRRDSDNVQSLPDILIAVQASLNIVAGNLNGAQSGKQNVDIQVLVNVVAQVKVILNGALDSVKLLDGRSVDVILTLGGKVLAAGDVAKLLVSVVTLVAAILSAVLRLVASADMSTVTPLVAAVAVVVVDLLRIVFTLVPAIVAALQPLLGAVVSLLVSIHLDVVVNALHGHF